MKREEIKERRKALGLTCKALGLLLGMSEDGGRSLIAAYERPNSGQTVTQGQLDKIDRVLTELEREAVEVAQFKADRAIKRLAGIK